MSRKKSRSPAQRVATARMLNPRKRRVSKKELVARLQAGKRAAKARRAKNKAGQKLAREANYRRYLVAKKLRRNPQRPARGQFQIAAAKGKNVLYLSGLGLSSNRATASNYGTLSTAKHVAKQLKDVLSDSGIYKRIAIVTPQDDPRAIRSFLLGEV